MFNTFEDVRNYTSRLFKTHEILNANEIINSLHICDPAVGSGHFLVSSLNEIISIKADLGILADAHGNLISGYEIEIANDELIITNPKGDILEYRVQNGKPLNKEMQRIQKTLFHEKQQIIENCLFGVDINPNSVKICRLRLWIELLKNAYYKEETNFTELETLPNIDINIKCGNSLVSRFAINADLSKALRSIKYDINAYRGFVNDYKNEKNREVKRGLQKIIDTIKADFRTQISRHDSKRKKLNKLQSEFDLLVAPNIFKEPDIDYGNKNFRKDKKEHTKFLQTEINRLSKEFSDIENNVIYKNAFEWRFEFPEVLNDKGEFEGFDVVIGNPPYIRVQNLKYNEIDFYKENYNSFYQRGDIYLLFFELGLKLIKERCSISLINPTLFITSAYGKALRKYLLPYKLAEFTDFSDLAIFQDVITYTGIFRIEKTIPAKINYRKFTTIENIENLIYSQPFEVINQTNLTEENWSFQGDSSNSIFNKIQKHPELANIAIINSGCFTGLDNCFFVDDKTIHDLGLEQKIIKPVIMGKEPKRYALQIPSKKAIYPYQMVNEKTEIINEDYFKTNFPNAYRYLEKNKDQLLGRKDSRKTFKESGKVWYSYTRKGLVNIFNSPKILLGYIVSDNTYCLDELGYIFSVGRAFSVSSKNAKVSNKYILALLNSFISRFLMESLCPIKQGGFFKISSEYLSKFPIPIIDDINQQPFIDLVDQILAQKQQGLDSSENERKIDDLVYQLYELTPEEIKIIEGK